MQDMSIDKLTCTSAAAERSYDDVLAQNFAAAKLLVERLPLSDVLHLHDWCAHVLAASMVRTPSTPQERAMSQIK